MIEQDGCRITPDIVQRPCTVTEFADYVDAGEGLDIREAEPGTTILVGTRNSLYRVTPIEPGDSRVLITGGQFFPEPTEAYLAGSTFGGSSLKPAWIGVGMHLEILAGGHPVTTSRVRSITKQAEVHARAAA